MTTVQQAPIIQGGGGGQPIQDPTSMISLMMQLKEFKARQEQQKMVEGVQKLDLGRQMAEQGMFVPELFEQGFKALKIDPNKVEATGKAMTPAQGAQSASPVSPQSAKKYPGGGVDQMGMGKLPQGVGGEAPQGGGSIMDMIQQRASAVQQKLQMDAQTAEMHGQVINESFAKLQEGLAKGDEDEIAKQTGRLMLFGGLKYEELPAKMGMLSSDQRKFQLGVMAGYETPQELNTRVSQVFGHLSTEYGKTPGVTLSDLQNAAQAIAQGKPIDVSLATKLNKQNTLRDQNKAFLEYAGTFGTDAAKRMSQAEALGIPADQALPTGYRTIAEKGLGIEQRKLSIMEQHYKDEKARWDAEDARMQEAIKAKAGKEQADIALQRLQTLTLIKKNGGKIDDSLYKQALNDVATGLGMDVKTVHHWIMPDSEEFVPKGLPEDIANAEKGSAQKGGESEGLLPKLGQFLSEGAPAGENPGKNVGAWLGTRLNNINYELTKSMINASPTMSPEEKRKQIEQLDQEYERQQAKLTKYATGAK